VDGQTPGDDPDRRAAHAGGTAAPLQHRARLFLWDGYDEIGIDHFARPTDSMAVAARTGHLRRNFQGYTDDTCDVLIGLGASAISKFPQGFAQNASATAQYAASVREGQMATGGSRVQGR
jgi:oxygen-independent coproporphyrinogen-3 oxidase